MEDQRAHIDAEHPATPPPDRSAPVRIARKVGIGAVGGVVTAAGVIMLVTPGPGILVTLAGLGILGREFPGARRQLQRLRNLASPSRRQPSDDS